MDWDLVMERLEGRIEPHTLALLEGRIRLVRGEPDFMVEATTPAIAEIASRHRAAILDACREEMLVPNAAATLGILIADAPAHAAAPGFLAWDEYLMAVRRTFLNCLNRRIPIRPRLWGYEREAIKTLYDRRIPIEKVTLGILRTFEQAIRDNRPVTSFRYCLYQVDAAVRERKL